MKVKVVWIETERTRHEAVIDVDQQEYEEWLQESGITHSDTLLAEFLQSGRDERRDWIDPAEMAETVRPERLPVHMGGYDQVLETASIEEGS